MPYCENKGQQLYYEVQGEGRPLFFIHSYLTSIDLWRSQIDHFAKSYRVIAMDLRGHGQSAISQPHSLYDMVDDACTVLDAVGVQRAVWCGLSIGGMISMRAALQCPSRVGGLALFATSSEHEFLHVVIERRILAILARTVGLNPMVGQVIKKNFGKTAIRRQPELIAEWRSRFLALHVPSMLNTLDALITRDNVASGLAGFAGPALVVHGNEDKAIHPKGADITHRAFQNCEYIKMKPAGHLVSLEHPEEVTGYLENFLSTRCENAWA